MPEFIVRAHAAPTNPGQFLAATGQGAHVEYLAQIVINTLFVSKGHRADVTLTLVLENSQDYSRTLFLAGEHLGDVGGQTESAVLAVIAEALATGAGLTKGASRVSPRGITVSALSFEHLVKQRLSEGKVVCLLDRKGKDIRAAELGEDVVVLLTDHVPMPKNLAKSLQRQGALPVSLGPIMLHASQCIVLVQNELDRGLLSSRPERA